MADVIGTLELTTGRRSAGGQFAEITNLINGLGRRQAEAVASANAIILDSLVTYAPRAIFANDPRVGGTHLATGLAARPGDSGVGYASVEFITAPEKAFLIPIMARGSSAHTIVAVNKRYLRFTWAGRWPQGRPGSLNSMTGTTHPGTAPNPWVQAAFDAVRAQVVKATQGTIRGIILDEMR